ncbi:MAG: VOC family protein [Verrucomicrobia bacterium]|nr:VOC family protein [Verrucomicrobiota bacterium]
MEFHHIALNCRDQKTIERYYVKHFGFERARVVSLGQGQEIVFLKGSGIHLELFHAEQAPNLPEATADGRALSGVIRHLAFKVADVDAKLAEMGEDGKRVTLGPLSFDGFIPGWRSAWLSDPEGNIIEISQGYVDQPKPPPLED